MYSFELAMFSTSIKDWNNASIVNLPEYLIGGYVLFYLLIQNKLTAIVIDFTNPIKRKEFDR